MELHGRRAGVARAAAIGIEADAKWIRAAEAESLEAEARADACQRQHRMRGRIAVAVDLDSRPAGIVGGRGLAVADHAESAGLTQPADGQHAPGRGGGGFVRAALRKRERSRGRRRGHGEIAVEAEGAAGHSVHGNALPGRVIVAGGEIQRDDVARARGGRNGVVPVRIRRAENRERLSGTAHGKRAGGSLREENDPVAGHEIRRIAAGQTR